MIHRIPDNAYILWVENVRNKQSSGQTRLMWQQCLTLPLIANEEEYPDSRQSHRAVHRALAPSIRRVERFVLEIKNPLAVGINPHHTSTSGLMETSGCSRTAQTRYIPRQQRC